jgi:hypothetical protein
MGTTRHPGRGVLIATAVFVPLFATGGAMTTASGATVPKAAEPPSRLLKAAIASGTKSGSVRVTVHFFSGKTTGELIQDSARQSAKQTVAIGKERISIVLTGGTAYFAGNSVGLVKYFGLSASTAATLAGQWISISPSDSGFQSVTAGMTLSSALREASPTGSISGGKKKKVDRQATVSVSGTGSTSAPRTTLFVAARGRPLPVEAVAESSSGKSAAGEIITFTRWGEKVTVPTPTDAIPVSTLSIGSSSG